MIGTWTFVLIAIFPTKLFRFLLQILTKTISQQLYQTNLQLSLGGYELYDNFIILSEKFSAEISPTVITEIIRKFKVKVIAKKQPIKNNDIRSPQLKFIYVHPSIDIGNFWTSSRQNGITYTWNPSYTMFCAGNIREKARIAKFNCTGQTVLDLYAGIGYFVIPYLILSGAAKVIAIDLNEKSIQALKRNAEINKIPLERLIIRCGNNQDFISEYEACCDRVNLGLLPSSQSGWQLAIRALKGEGGWMHIHENVAEGKEKEFGEFLQPTLKAYWMNVKMSECSVYIENIQRVKSFSPKVYHLVYDVQIRKC